MKAYTSIDSISIFYHPARYGHSSEEGEANNGQVPGGVEVQRLETYHSTGHHNGYHINGKWLDDISLLNGKWLDDILLLTGTWLDDISLLNGKWLDDILLLNGKWLDDILLLV